MPTYNQSEFIVYALNSVKNQSYQDWECLIIDDGSTDITEKLVRDYILDDIRFKYYKKENNGASTARNFGLDKAKGDYILFLDSDDYIIKDKLLKSLNKFEKSESSDLVISNFNMFRIKFEEYLPAFCKLEGRDFNFDSLLLGWDIDFNIPIHCALFKASLFNSVRFNEAIKSKEDWIMWVTIFQNGAKAIFINESLSFYRYNDNGNRYNDDNNFIQAHQIIYNLLDDKNKNKFFDRVTKELHKTSLGFVECKENYKSLSLSKSKFKRTIRKIKKWFKKS